jgi:2-keto-4-pentenoate hydratase/2-oxohepta-3-ene-1,7-dioic acid hydratase in catechol pathway
VGKEQPGAVDAGGVYRDLSGLAADFAGDGLSPDRLAKLAEVDLTTLPEIPAESRIGACIGHVGNFIAVGLNFSDHAEEAGLDVPAEPILFNKAPSCVVGPFDDVIIPPGSVKTDWEVELAIVIGKRGYQLDEAIVAEHIAGYCVCNDVSEREYQIERGGQWTKGKGCPTFGPLGPWLVTGDEIENIQNLSMWLDVNGQQAQRGSTEKMIFGAEYLVSYISRFMELMPGDVITTGTPPGVGMGMKPPRFLKAGDVVALGIEGLGKQRQIFVSAETED